jgi:lipopolysaccharide/colanic/teichoic acid biosynthesis glycosyltransferase
LDVLPDRLGLKRPDRADGRASGSEPLIPHVGGLFWASKRIFDVAASAILLTLTAPIAILVLIFVLLDCGLPVMFWQMRVGRLGRRITVYKFRTLRAPYTRDGDVRPEQERVSAIGRLLRRTHVDELPQLFSILRGEMSFIGPRPLLPVDLSRQAKLRFAVRPGISGWAQVNGATSLTIEEKNAMDEWYIRHASWGVEFAIVVKTLKAIFAVMRRNEPAIQAALTEQNASMSLAARCQSSGEMAADRHP